MGVILPKRFDPIRFLRKDRGCCTLTATDQRLGLNEVVVKVVEKGSFSDDLSSVQEVLSWHRGVRHPYISEILDAGLTPRRALFYVRACHPPSELFARADADSLKTLVAAVDFLHSRGRMHGGIRPSNVFSAGAVARLADPWIGQKRPLEEEDIRFTAPEVLNGGVPTVDSDLYSLGAVLYRFYSGRDPFEGSDLESLKAKYIWAYPRPLVSVSHVSKAIGEIVAGLIHKDAGQRKSAFEALKEELDVQPETATRAPSIGCEVQVEKTVRFLLDRAKLRVAMMEGPAGSGKSRFAEEVRAYAGFRVGERAVTVCEVKSPEPHASLVRRIVSLIDEQKLAVGSSSLLRLKALIEPDARSITASEQEETERDLINLLASIGRQLRLLIVIDDIDRGNRKLLKFLEGMARHASELELAILGTSRPHGVPARTTGVFTDFLGDNFQRQTLELLSQSDAETLSRFLASDPDRRAHAVERAGGNPAFLEEYCGSPKSSVIPRRVRKTLSTIITRLPKQARSLAQVLSLFDHPISWDVLGRITETSEPQLRESVAALEQTGLVDSRQLSIRYPDAAALLQSRIPKPKRTELHARCFQYLQEANAENAILARHAFHGGLLDTAGALYLQLAREAFSRKDYEDAGTYYGFVSECPTHGREGIPLAAEDRVNVAHCYAQQGNGKRARTILKHLLSSLPPEADPELLSSVYVALASHFVEDSPQERIRLHQLAIRSLPKDSPQLVVRYLALATALISAGNVAASERALKAAKLRCNSSEIPSQLEVVRAHVLAHRGRFKDAAECLSGKQFPWANSWVISTNHATYVEQLGNLREARDLQISALQEAETSGALVAQIGCLGNLGAMESKLGDCVAAERYFGLATSKLRALKHQDQGGSHNFGIIYADAALHFTQKGDYRKALDYLSSIDAEWPSRFLLEMFFMVLVRCEVSLALGMAENAAQSLSSTRSLQMDGDFFEIERLLIDARLRRPSAELCDRLKDALQASRRLETAYQECRILLTLATLQITLNDLDQARNAARAARRIAVENGYQPLAAQALLAVGLSTKSEIEKEFAFNRCMNEARGLELAPLVAECAFRIGAWKLNRGEYTEAQDSLSKSVSLTAHLAEPLSNVDRRGYLSSPNHREARILLQTASVKASNLPVKLPDLLGIEGSFFAHLYRLAASITAAVDLASATGILVDALRRSIDHCTVVVLGNGASMLCHPVRRTLSEEVRRRVIDIGRMANGRPYLTGLGTEEKGDAALWMPILSLAVNGGIYVEHVPDGPPLNEREIEFLTIVAAIAGAAFDRVCSRNQAIPELSATEVCGIVGSSSAIRDVHARIQIAAANAATVLIEGESGTGKELVARAIHEQGPRAKGPFVPVDCGALPEGLIEAEMFGTRKGAYTGAVADRHGLFEAANHGTIFLDEISNIGLAAQAKLLRVLQEKEVRRVGSVSGRTVDVRVIAATNCDLERLVREGKFRQDLLYRLKVLHIVLPPLRERKSDIPMLATTFLERLNAANHTRKYFGPGVLESFLEHTFPGNVRELQNAVERGFYSTGGAVIAGIEFSHEWPGREERDDDTESWFRELTEGKTDFWSAVHDRYKRRDISRESVIALMDIGLRAAHGNYKVMASMFQIPKEQYRRFMDFLRRNQCLLDFRPYRKARAPERTFT